jgi:predicted chitinase
MIDKSSDYKQIDAPNFWNTDHESQIESLWYSAKALPSIWLKYFIHFETLLSQAIAKLMVFKLITAASRT